MDFEEKEKERKKYRLERKKEVGGRYATTKEIMLAFAKVKRARFARVTHRIQTFPLPCPQVSLSAIYPHANSA